MKTPEQKEANRRYMQAQRAEISLAKHKEKLRKQGKCFKCHMLLSSKLHTCELSPE